MNIQPGKLKKQRKHSQSPGASFGTRLAAVAKFALLVAAIAAILNTYIYLNQKITETERAIQKTEKQLKQTEREIAQLRIHRERLSAWPHIRMMITRFELGLREPAPGQVERMALLSPSQAARIPLESIATNRTELPARTASRN